MPYSKPRAIGHFKTRARGHPLAGCLVKPASSSLASGPAPLPEGLCQGWRDPAGGLKARCNTPGTEQPRRPPFAAAPPPPPPLPARASARPRPFPNPGRGAGPRLRGISLAPAPRTRGGTRAEPLPWRCCLPAGPGSRAARPSAPPTGCTGDGGGAGRKGSWARAEHRAPPAGGERALPALPLRCVCVWGGADSKTGTVPPEVCVWGLFLGMTLKN